MSMPNCLDIFLNLDPVVLFVFLLVVALGCRISVLLVECNCYLLAKKKKKKDVIAWSCRLVWFCGVIK